MPAPWTHCATGTFRYLSTRLAGWKGWSDKAGTSSSTLSERAKRMCPAFPPGTFVTHWSTPDLSEEQPGGVEEQAAIREVLLVISRRIDLLVTTALEKLGRIGNPGKSPGYRAGLPASAAAITRQITVFKPIPFRYLIGGSGSRDRDHSSAELGAFVRRSHSQGGIMPMHRRIWPRPARPGALAGLLAACNPVTEWNRLKTVIDE